MTKRAYWGIDDATLKEVAALRSTGMVEVVMENTQQLRHSWQPTRPVKAADQPVLWVFHLESEYGNGKDALAKLVNHCAAGKDYLHVDTAINYASFVTMATITESADARAKFGQAADRLFDLKREAQPVTSQTQRVTYNSQSFVKPKSAVDTICEALAVPDGSHLIDTRALSVSLNDEDNSNNRIIGAIIANPTSSSAVLKFGLMKRSFRSGRQNAEREDQLLALLKHKNFPKISVGVLNHVLDAIRSMQDSHVDAITSHAELPQQFFGILLNHTRTATQFQKLMQYQDASNVPWTHIDNGLEAQPSDEKEISVQFLIDHHGDAAELPAMITKHGSRQQQELSSFNQLADYEKPQHIDNAISDPDAPWERIDVMLLHTQDKAQISGLIKHPRAQMRGFLYDKLDEKKITSFLTGASAEKATAVADSVIDRFCTDGNTRMLLNSKPFQMVLLHHASDNQARELIEWARAIPEKEAELQPYLESLKQPKRDIISHSIFDDFYRDEPGTDYHGLFRLALRYSSSLARQEIIQKLVCAPARKYCSQIVAILTLTTADETAALLNSPQAVTRAYPESNTYVFEQPPYTNVTHAALIDAMCVAMVDNDKPKIAHIKAHGNAHHKKLETGFSEPHGVYIEDPNIARLSGDDADKFLMVAKQHNKPAWRFSHAIKEAVYKDEKVPEVNKVLILISLPKTPDWKVPNEQQQMVTAIPDKHRQMADAMRTVMKSRPQLTFPQMKTILSSPGLYKALLIAAKNPLVEEQENQILSYVTKAPRHEIIKLKKSFSFVQNVEVGIKRKFERAI